MMDEQLPADNTPKETTPPSEQPAPNQNLSLAFGALSMAALGQFFLSAIPGKLAEAFIFFCLSGLTFIILIWRVEHGKSQPRNAIQKLNDWLFRMFQRITAGHVLVFVSLGIAYTLGRAISSRPGNKNFWDIFFLWGTGILLYAFAYVKFNKANFKTWFWNHRFDILYVVILTLSAAVLRFIWLGEAPRTISGDEGQIGKLMRNVLTNWNAMNMFGTTYGHGNLYLFIMAGFTKLIGEVDIFSLRFTSALAGTLTIPTTYIFARRFFNTRTAVIAAGLLAVSHFHLHFSRVIVAGSIQDALFTPLVWYLFLDGLDRRSASQMTISGLVLGIFMHIYMGARLTILLVPVYVLALWITNPKVVRENLGNLLVFAGALLVSALPIAQWAYLHPDEFNARMNQIGIIQSGWLAQEAARTGQSEFYLFLIQLRDAFLSISYYPAKGFYFSERPMLDAVSAVFFMLGLLYSLFHITDKRYLLLNGWLWSSVLVGGALVVLPAIAAYRILMTLPAILIFTALGFDRLLEYAATASEKIPVRIISTLALLAVVGALNLQYYFGEYAFTCKYDDANAHLASYMGESLGDLGNSYQAFFMGAPRYRYGIHPSTDFLSNNNIITNLDAPLTAPPNELNAQPPVVFYFVPERANELAYVKELFPNGVEEIVSECNLPLLIIYHVP